MLDQVNLNFEQVQALQGSLRGELLRPGDAAYAEACQIYNGMINRHPALIARCVDVADVITAVNFARDTQLPLAIRGGGHNGAGLSLVDDGLVIDLSL
ncbi:MAG: FAD-binding protein, partial [Chloroflexota bacterium]